ncbi:hypothetical protein [Nocardiopsis sp. SBT366]|jgi:hypothetical protein|uniref:hypothetical protein n=1 Tax=Nocardiopsis sp. SBT366 TaxID=1580529 RepID=UPI00066DDFC1|nr:hypothetical protein [Nocardiopsis sp. SBT366]
MLPSVIMILIITASVLLTAAYASHKVAIEKSDVLTPDMDYMDTLEEKLDEIHETQIEIARAEASLKARVMTLENEVSKMPEEGQHGSVSYARKDLLKSRESSESDAKTILGDHTP